MVFEGISKGLSHLGKTTLKTGKSVAKTTSRAGKVVTDPLTGVAKKTIKYVPFVGADDDIWDLSHDHFALELFEDEFKKASRRALTQIKKAKVPATKLTLLKKSLDQIAGSLDHETNLEHGEAEVLHRLKQLTNQISKSLPTSYEKGKRVAAKKVTLTSAQKVEVKEQLKELQTKTEDSIHALKNLTQYIATKPSSSYQGKAKTKQRREKNHELIDELITAKFDIVTHQKKLYYLLLELQRKTKKSTRHKNTLTQTGLQDIVKTKIPSHMKIIAGLRTDIKKLESQVDENRASFDTGAEKWLGEVRNRLTLNKKETKKAQKRYRGDVKKSNQAVDKMKKSYINMSAALIKNTKKPYDVPDKLQASITKELDAYTGYSEAVIHRMTNDFAQYLQSSKDLELSKMLVQEHINLEYDGILLNKEQSMHLGLLNRIHKKQIAAATKIKNQLKKLKTMAGVPSITSIASWNSKEIKHINTKVSASTKQKDAYKKTVKDQYDLIKQWRTLNMYLGYSAIHTASTAEHDLKRSMIAYLEKEKSHVSSHIEDQQKLVKDVESTLKKSEIQLRENERSAFTLQDAKRSKDAIAFEKQVHAQELTLDTLEHHIDTEKDVLFIIKDNSGDYSSDTKKLLKKAKKEQKWMKEYAKKLKKNALAKKLMKK